MKTLTPVELETVAGGADSFATDAGQFFGAMAGWVRANLGLYTFLGPGVGGAVAIVTGLEAAGE